VTGVPGGGNHRNWVISMSRVDISNKRRCKSINQTVCLSCIQTCRDYGHPTNGMFDVETMMKSTQADVRKDGSVRKDKSRTEDMNKWVSELVSQIKEPAAVTKADRMERRLAKKRRYEQTRQQDQQRECLNASSNKFDRKNSRENRINKASRCPVQAFSDSELETDRKSVIRLRRLIEKLDERMILVKERRKTRQKPFLPAPVLLAKTVQRQRLQAKNGDFFQPRASGYGGIGLARPSLYIPFDDPSWQPKLEEEFLEHIPGFFGKQRTKAMKKQLDGQMLWRQLLKQKEEQSQTKRRIKLNGRDISTMTPDERVEVLLRTGAI
jgi:hypothetical protein